MVIIRARDFRIGLERKSVILRSQQSRLYLDEAHITLETVKVLRQTYLSKKDTKSLHSRLH